MHNRLLQHVLFWIVYLLEDTTLEFAWIRASYPDLSEGKLFLLALQSGLMLIPPKLIFVYFLLYVSIDRGVLLNRKMYRIVLELTGVLLVAVIMHRAIVHFYIHPILYKGAWEDDILFDPKRLLSAVLDVGFVAGGAVALKLLRMYFLGREKQKNLAKEKLEAELKFLRTQTNPHFLFNTLNNIYALARKKFDKTADVVMRLSKLLRFMLYESRKEKIPLEDELRMIADYIELEKIRYDERLKISFTKQLDNSSQLIAPLLLLPFIENAFKHGAGEARHESYIDVNVFLQQGNLDFRIRNSKDSDVNHVITENIGLSNVKRQLELMYSTYSLNVQNESNFFFVQLTVNLNDHAIL